MGLAKGSLPLFEIRLSYVACGYWEAHGTASSNERAGEQVVLASEVRGGGMVKGCPAETPPPGAGLSTKCSLCNPSWQFYES